MLLIFTKRLKYEQFFDDWIHVKVVCFGPTFMVKPGISL